MSFILVLSESSKSDVYILKFRDPESLAPFHHSEQYIYMSLSRYFYKTFAHNWIPNIYRHSSYFVAVWPNGMWHMLAIPWGLLFWIIASTWLLLRRTGKSTSAGVSNSNLSRAPGGIFWGDSGPHQVFKKKKKTITNSIKHECYNLLNLY